MEGAEVVHVWAKFHVCLISSSGVFKFQMFSKKQKVWFYAAFGMFFQHNPPKFGQVASKYLPVLQHRAMNQICDGLYRKGLKWAKKLTFWAIFRPFSFTPSYALWVTPKFSASWKVLLRYIILISFIIIPFLVLKLETFKCFRRSRKSNFWLLLSGFSTITPPNEVGFVQNLDQLCIARQCIIYITVFWKMSKFPKNSAKNLNFWLIFNRFFITPSHAL